MKDYTVELSAQQGNELMEQLSDKMDVVTDYEVQGGLLDSYGYSDMGSIKLGRVKPRKYWTIKANYLNEWSSDYILTMSDDSTLFDKLEAESYAQAE